MKPLRVVVDCNVYVSLLIGLLTDAGTIHPDNTPGKAISRDPDDDYLLALAKATKADVLLTGDEDLIVLQKHGRTRILNARGFVKEFLK